MIIVYLYIWLFYSTSPLDFSQAATINYVINSNMQDLVHDAIEAALSHNFEKAISLNQTVLKENPNDIDAMNRLAHAYTKTGEINEAKKIYHKILSLDHYNIIAQKNLEKITTLPKISKKRKFTKKTSLPIFLSPSLFIAEPGKTKIVTLINTAPASILSSVSSGEKAILYPKRRSIEVRDENNTYVGALPDDIAFHLLRLLRAGNVYQAWIKNATKSSISILIKEVKRSKRFSHQPSFITSLPEAKHQMGKRLETEKEEERLEE